MPDDAPQAGQRVWRVDHHGFPSVVQPYSYLEEESVETFYRREPSKIGTSHTITPGVWHPTDPEALAEMRSALLEGGAS